MYMYMYVSFVFCTHSQNRIIDEISKSKCVHVQQVVLAGYMTAKVAEKENQVMSEASYKMIC